jgi:hypothetical protein
MFESVSDHPSNWQCVVDYDHVVNGIKKVVGDVENIGVFAEIYPCIFEMADKDIVDGWCAIDKVAFAAAIGFYTATAVQSLCKTVSHRMISAITVAPVIDLMQAGLLRVEADAIYLRHVDGMDLIPESPYE